ncbi:glycine zipper 2TM domain-containing protein [Lutimaribacter marinistellae]|uniref:Glycine zipper 2TM domain-containing protein n=1 Tax=Lutimaribacter marinistellae TaxID=1820329 RepID=A0ABV7TK12_9RHOB
MFRRFGILAVLPVVITVSACSPAAQHEAACVGGTLTGATIGGAIGNRFGGGTGQSIMTAAGALVGGVTAANSMNCVRPS